MKKHLFLIVMLLGCAWAGSALAHTVLGEPVMADYTAFPIFSSQSVPPNIMIILDNSESMNYNAYGTYPGDGGTVTDSPFMGEPYSGTRSLQVISGQDDAEEGVVAGSVAYHNDPDLDLGGWSVDSNDSIVGLRFQHVAIPQGVKILSAYLEFNANASNAQTTYLRIDGEASDNAVPFAATADNIKGRTGTTAVVPWDNVQAWTAGQNYTSPDIKAIVQEIVDRPGWASGSAVVFRIAGSGTTGNKRDIRAYDRDATLAPKLHVVFDNEPDEKKYYGYFNPDYFYKYGSQVFTLAYKKINYTGTGWDVTTLDGSKTTLSDAAIVSNGLWDGNWLNWLSMRRIDVLRKVLMGGKATARTGGGNQVNYGETPNIAANVYSKVFNSSVASAVSPHDGNFTYRIEGGSIYVGGTSYSLRIQRDIKHEPESFTDGNLSGVLQKMGDKARWGNIWFNKGTGSNQSGGTVEHTIGTNMTTLITDLQNTGCDAYSPLAESYYVAMQYFKQQAPQSGLDYPNSAVPCANIGDDPWYNGKEFVPCAKSFVLLLTDGASSKDSKIPAAYMDFDRDGRDNNACNELKETDCDYSEGGTDFLDDLALYARTTDLRSATVGKSALDGVQDILLYAVHAFGSDPEARRLLMDAARNGGFEDRNNNQKPDLAMEWDADGNGIPDTFFEASDGYELEARLLAAISDILRRAASGTSASVLATNSEGEGHMIQAYFRPSVLDGLEEVRWLGYMQSLWVDAYGVLHEDTNQNAELDDGDLPVEFTTGPDGDTMALRDGLTVPLEDITPIFEAGKRLRDRDPAQRRIFTFIDRNQDGAVDEGSHNPFDTTGEVISFGLPTAAAIQPYLGVANDTAWGTAGAKLGASHDARVSNIITWVRGTDVPGLRNRTLAGSTWRLGDIINSTPVSIARPPDQYHIIYSDKSYLAYWEAMKDRETMVYVGANDGMLHAFTHWKFNRDANKFEQPANTEEKLGDEAWAFIPQSVLPHLKWVAQYGYTHTYLVDAKPRVFDAKILPDDTHYTDADGDENWGTFLVMGLNMGAKHIHANEDFGSGPVTRDFHPTYFMLDITDPRNPRLMWERTYPNLAMSRSRPAPIKVGNEWFLVFGSGPTDYDGNSSQPGYIYVADMKTGEMRRQFGPLDNNAFFNEPASFDKNLNFNVDAIYAGDAFYASNRWQGSLYKVAVPCTNCDWDSSYNPLLKPDYNEDPAQWTVSKLFTSERPITAPVSISVELYPDINIDNVWIYFGTGRYIAKSDIPDNSQQYLFGIKDPFFNTKDTDYFHDFAKARTLTRADLLRSDEFTVTTFGTVLKNNTLYGGFDKLEQSIRGDNNDGTYYHGWYRLLATNGSAPSERVVSKPTLLGGMVFVPVFTPDVNVCGFGGQTSFYALYYATGTGYFKQIFNLNEKRYVTIGGRTEEVVEVKLPESFLGIPPPGAGMHAGREKGAKAFLQQSTGLVLELELNPPFYFRSAIIDWWD